MSDFEIQLCRARKEDYPFIETALEAGGLSSQGISESPVRMYVACDGDNPIGCGGIETAGKDGLLRSISIIPSERGRGIGSRMCQALISKAKRENVERLYLLTETAEHFFAKLGFTKTKRSSVPHAIAATTEFASLCPETAVCMVFSTK